MFTDFYFASGYLLFLALLSRTMAVRSKRLGFTVAACLLGAIGGLGSLYYYGNVGNADPSLADAYACYLIVELAVWRSGIRALLLGQGILSRTGKAVRALACTLSLLTPFLPYLPVEAQTTLWGRSLAPAAQEAVIAAGGEDDRVRTVKVLALGMSWAKVYVVTHTKGMPGYGKDAPWPAWPGHLGWVVELHRSARGWEPAADVDAVCVWSDLGNADYCVFPPYDRLPYEVPPR